VEELIVTPTASQELLVAHAIELSLDTPDTSRALPGVPSVMGSVTADTWAEVEELITNPTAWQLPEAGHATPVSSEVPGASTGVPGVPESIGTATPSNSVETEVALRFRS
jgi:hypothetical protein